jgi:ribosomal protein S27E
MTSTEVGARLRCENCGTEIIVVKRSTDEIRCCGSAMEARDAEGSA